MTKRIKRILTTVEIGAVAIHHRTVLTKTDVSPQHLASSATGLVERKCLTIFQHDVGSLTFDCHQRHQHHHCYFSKFHFLLSSFIQPGYWKSQSFHLSPILTYMFFCFSAIQSCNFSSLL